MIPPPDLVNRPTPSDLPDLYLKDRSSVSLLLLSVCLIAVCAIVYELVIAALSSYLLGNSIYQFSITIGLFMSSMGIGSFLSKYFKQSLIARFIQIEIAVGFVGGVSTVVLFNTYLFFESEVIYLGAMVAFIVIVGTLVGLEIPLLIRIIEQRDSLRVTVANVLAFDYIGSLIGAIAFPLFLLKYTGLIQTTFVISLLNIVVAAVTLVTYRSDIEKTGIWMLTLFLIGGGLGVANIFSNQIDTWLENRLYLHPIIFSKQSRYQKIIVTKPDVAKESKTTSNGTTTAKIELETRRGDVRLFIDGNLQFSSVDEYRYHEALVHPAMSLAQSRNHILVLGGGDGMAVREILKYPEVKRLFLIDIDPEITELCANHPEIVALNQGALSDPRVTILNQDAYRFVENPPVDYQDFDVVVIDLPDPNHESLSKLYSVTFYSLLWTRLSEGGVLVSQSTSPFFSRYAFWCIHNSMETAGLKTYAYHLDVPSMGDWGFNLAARRQIEIDRIHLSVSTDFLTDTVAVAMFRFGKDINRVETQPNTIVRPVLQFYYHDKKWRYY